MTERNPLGTHFINVVLLLAFQLCAGIQKFTDVESVAPAVIGQIFVIRVFRNIVLFGMEGLHTIDLQNALVTGYDGEFIERQKFAAQGLATEAGCSFSPPVLTGVVVE